MKLVEQPFGVAGLDGALGDAHPILQGMPLRLGNLLHHVADLMHLPALDKGGVAGHHCRSPSRLLAAGRQFS